MFKTPSPTPPTRSPAAPPESAKPEAGDRDARALMGAMRQVEALGVYGLVWLDADLAVKRVFGRIVDFVGVGRPVTDSLVPLIGIEDDIRALRGDAKRALQLPTVSIADASGDANKMNFTVFWSAADDAFVVLASRSDAQAELELQLSAQIRARMIAEAEIAAKSRELARANADLESFASIVSHDLKAPLRHMRYLAGEAEKFAAAGAAPSLKQISAQAERLSKMLERLFEYSSLGRKYEALETCDTRAVVESIIASLPPSGIAVEVEGEWPKLVTLCAPLELVLRNLICNAQQHHDRESGLVRVACADSQDALVITVTDDGPGVAPRHQAAIFQPFRTLKGEAATSTGMGLAMVERVVASVGGAVTMSSNPAEARGA